MQSDSKNSEEFNAYYQNQKAKDPSLQIIRQDELVPMNDPHCPHEMCHLDESETDFDVMICNKCGYGAVYPYGTFRNKLKKEN